VDLGAVGRRAAEDAGGLDPGLLGGFLPTVVQAAGSGRRLAAAEVEDCARQGAAAAQAGVPLRALVDLYLSASWRLWRELPVVTTGTAAQVRAAGLAVLRAADDGVAALAEGFQLARGDLVRRQDAERREVFEALLAGGLVAEDALGRAVDLGLDLASPHAVFVAVRTGAPEPGAAAALLGRLERALAGRLGDAPPLLLAREGQLVGVFAAPDAPAVEQVTRRASAVLGEQWQLAVGRARAGPTAVRASYEQARDTLEVAARLGLSVPVVTSREVAVYRVLLRDRAAMAELITTALGPLDGVRGGAVPLLETLDAYYGSGGVVTDTARRLHLSVRAVTYRLARVRAVLDRDPTDPQERFALHAAVLGARLLDWPATPLEAT
jgi:GGDEF-like domain/PucR C-terminal helix-turn-helix domain